MADQTLVRVNAKNLKTDPLSDALTYSEEMRPYLEAHEAKLTGNGFEQAINRIKALPADRRYLTRVSNNLDLALVDLDTETARFDIETMSVALLVEMLDNMKLRLEQLALLVEFMNKTTWVNQ